MKWEQLVQTRLSCSFFPEKIEVCSLAASYIGVRKDGAGHPAVHRDLLVGSMLVSMKAEVFGRRAKGAGISSCCACCALYVIIFTSPQLRFSVWIKAL